MIRELDMKPIKDTALPNPHGFQGVGTYVYSAYTLRICLTNSLGTKKVTIGVFYAYKLHREDIILRRP
jgi:hypothetical protein